jgi:hypothetical protein
MGNKFAQQENSPLTCEDLQSTVEWIFEQKDGDFRAALQGQYDEQGWNDLGNLVC